MNEFTITTAERKASPVSVFIQGVSGSGKTYSALLLARGLAGPGEKIGIIDTEGGRSLIYADDPDIGGFEHLAFSAPFGPDRCIAAFDAAVKAGWKAIILDSASLEHDGEGGLLDMAEQEEEKILAKNPNSRGASQQKWTAPKLAHKRFLNHVCGLPVHVLMCFRETLTTDFTAKPPATIKSVVTEKNTLFSLELHCAINEQHKAHWSRIPKPYLGCIKQDSMITTATGRLLSDSPSIGAVRKPAAPAAPDTSREDALLNISDFIDSENIDVADFNAAIESTYKGKFLDYEKLPTEHLVKLATDSALKKMAALADRIKEGVEA